MRVELVRRLVAATSAVVCVWVAAGSRTSEASDSALAFDVRATTVKDLHPGAVRRMRLTVVNPYPFPISVSRLGARLVSTSKRACEPTATNLRVGSHPGRLPFTVPARGRKVHGELEVAMPNTAADACQRTTFRLAITATATRVKR